MDGPLLEAIAMGLIMAIAMVGAVLVVWMDGYEISDTED